MLLKAMPVLIMLILNSFNPELQLKDTESAIKIKLIELLAQLRGFKCVTTLVLVFKKIEIKDKTKYYNFYSISKAEIIIIESDIKMCLNQCILQLQQNTKIFRERFKMDY